jgi:hypothetical protein
LGALFAFLKRLLLCGYGERSIPPSDAPEIDPRDLPRRDPFISHVFSFDSGCYAFRSETKEKVWSLFSSLGSGSYWSWIPKAISLTKLEDAIVALKPHPLAFLYYLFCNRDHTAHVVHFRKEATRGRWLLKVKTGRDPWEEFVGRQAENFAAQTDLREMLPGFCAALDIDKNKALEYARDKRWKELTLYIVETRKKHFNL